MSRKYEIKDISDRIVSRLTLYLGILRDLQPKQNEINSIELATKMNTTAVQVRKDLSTFGEFGVRGKGYNIAELIERIENILGIDEENDLIIIGYGKMGSMLASNIEILGKGFKVLGIFEKDETKIGMQVGGHIIRNINECEAFIKAHKIEMAILAVNSEYGQLVADILKSYGIKAILNMTATKLEVGNNMAVVNVDVSAKLKELNFWRINSDLKHGDYDS